MCSVSNRTFPGERPVQIVALLALLALLIRRLADNQLFISPQSPLQPTWRFNDLPIAQIPRLPQMPHAQPPIAPFGPFGQIVRLAMPVRPDLVLLHGDDGLFELVLGGAFFVRVARVPRRAFQLVPIEFLIVLADYLLRYDRGEVFREVVLVVVIGGFRVDTRSTRGEKGC